MLQEKCKRLEAVERPEGGDTPSMEEVERYVPSGPATDHSPGTAATRLAAGADQYAQLTQLV